MLQLCLSSRQAQDQLVNPLDLFSLEKTMQKTPTGQTLMSLVQEFRALCTDPVEESLMESIIVGKPSVVGSYQSAFRTVADAPPGNMSYLALAKHQLTLNKNSSDPYRLTKIIFLINWLCEVATHEKIVRVLFDDCTVQVVHFVNHIMAGLMVQNSSQSNVF